MKVLAVTGYKPHELGITGEKHEGIPVIKRALTARLRSLLDEGLEWVITSGQPGVELWASEAVLELKQDYPHIKLAVLTPFLEQESRWPDSVKKHYFDVLKRADLVDTITKRPYEHPSQLRLKNAFIVKKSDGLLCLYDEETPGSPEFYLSEAKRRGENEAYPILYINRYDIDAASQEIAEEDPRYWDQ